MQPSNIAISGDTTDVEERGSTSQPDPRSLVYQAEASIQGRLPLSESLGRTGLITILGGSILILICIAFLSFLWFGSGHEPEAAGAPWVWRQIALHDWMTRTITISALVLRSIVSLQVALCTSMTAALVLEKRSARKTDVAYLSIARSVSDGPRKLIQLLLSSRSWSVLTYVELWLICLLALVMLALQFSSTLLLSDLHNFIIVGDAETKTVANFGSFTIPLDNDLSLQPYILSGPMYPTFGEERSNSDLIPTTSGFSDTGVIRRGYLPFQGSEYRTSVRRYRGSTLVTNSRTVCVPPRIEGHFLPQNGGITYLNLGHITGTVDYGRSLRQAHEGVGSLCAGRGFGRTSEDIYALSTSELYKQINMEGEPWSLNSTMFLVFRSSLTPLDWNAIVDPHPIPLANATGEWNRFEIVGGRSVDISLCFTRFYVRPQSVEMVTHKPTHEPVVLWDGYSLEHDTTAVAAFIGPGSLKTPTDRGLMDMDILDVKSLGGLELAELTAALLQRSVIGEATNTLIPGSTSGCVFCTDYSVPTSAEYDLLFTDTIQSTGRAAPALHTSIAIIAAAAYDTLLRAFNVTEAVELTTTTSVHTPGPCSEHRCYGFISVITLLGTHLVFVTLITTLYIGQVRYSRLSNTWHTISQLMGEELEDVLDRGNNAKDKSIMKALKCDGRDDFVRLGLASGSTRVQVLKYTENGQKPGELKKRG
ncbi:hypothetical protein F4801DRAFT_596024 [Xylaria longipes]|nr:hypothetical protein F4801DRAFT_596024 [Xylaria longipes]